MSTIFHDFEKYNEVKLYLKKIGPKYNFHKFNISYIEWEDIFFSNGRKPPFNILDVMYIGAMLDEYMRRDYNSAQISRDSKISKPVFGLTGNKTEDVIRLMEITKKLIESEFKDSALIQAYHSQLNIAYLKFRKTYTNSVKKRQMRCNKL